MKNLKRLFLLLLLISFYSTSHARDLEDQINKACLRHAVSLVTQLKSEVAKDLTQSQLDQALKIAADSCQAYFNKEFSEMASLNNDNNKKTDSLTEKILSGEVERKAGNKRLLKKH